MELDQFAYGSLSDDVNQQAVPKLTQPRNHKAHISVWTDLSVNDVDTLSCCATADGIRQELAKIFRLEDWENNARSAILLDLYYYTVQFAQNNGFNKEQLSAFFSIVKKTHDVCVETPFGNVENCFQFFRDMVLCHAVKRPPFSIDLFNGEEVRKISEYVINTYFRHYKLYKYAFTPRVTLDLTFSYLGEPPTPEQTELASNAGDELDEELEQLAGSNEDIKPAVEEEPVEDEEAMTELRRLVRMHLTEELKNLRSSVDQQLKATEDAISKKLEVSESSQVKSPPTPGAGGKDRKDAKQKKK